MHDARLDPRFQPSDGAIKPSWSLNQAWGLINQVISTYLQGKLALTPLFNYHIHMMKAKNQELTMKWQQMREQYPNQFILIGNVLEEQISDTMFRIIGGELIEVSKDPKKIQRLYQEHKNSGKNVLYALPTTPNEFIVENIPIYGVFKWNLNGEKGLIWVSLNIVYEGQAFEIPECILDTGSASTAIDIDNVKFNYQKPAKIKRLIGVGGGIQEVLSQTVDQVILDDQCVSNMAIEFGNLQGDMGINGFIGTDLLSQFKITIDSFEESIILHRWCLPCANVDHGANFEIKHGVKTSVSNACLLTTWLDLFDFFNRAAKSPDNNGNWIRHLTHKTKISAIKPNSRH